MGLLKRSFVLSCGVAATTLLLVHEAGAASFTIGNGQTVHQTQILDTAGDVGTVELGGAIEADTPPGNGIEATASGVTVDNAGSITGFGGSSSGVLVLDNSTITNTGGVTGGLAGITVNDGNTITNSGTATGGDDGIFVHDGNTITNSGDATGASAGISAKDGNTITNSGAATGTSGSGISAHNDNTITNSGVAQGVSDGIFASDRNTITNSGTATGLGGSGISAGDFNTITNSGVASGGDGISASLHNVITNSGVAAGLNMGMFAVTGNTITNTGTVTGGVNGIWVNNSNTITNTGTVLGDAVAIKVNNGNTIVNSGKVSGHIAAELQGSENTVTLLAGSAIEGDLLLGNSSNSLIIGHGLETALTFTGTPIIDTSGQPFVIAGNTLYVVNATVFSVQDEMTSDLSRAVTGAVEGRLAWARLSGGGGVSMAMNGMTITPTADVPAASDNGIWLSGLGAYRDQDSDGLRFGFETALGGAMAGIDGMVADTTRAGLFAGIAFAGLDADGGAQDLDSDNYFGGLYLGHEMGAGFIDFSLTAGWSDFHSDRAVANNLVEGGIEHAKADYGGFLISPSVKFGADLAVGSGTLTPSLRLRYAGLFLDGYTESGSAANLTVDDRDINIFDIRGELAYRFAALEMSDGTLSHAVRFGVEGTFSDADSVDVILAGQALQLDISGDDVARGFAGYDVVYATTGNARFNLSAEAGYDTGDALTLEGQAGIAWTF